MVNTNIRFDPTSYNKFFNLDSVETRIIDFLRDTETEECERIWKLLKYSDMKALFRDNLTVKEKNDLIYKDSDEKDKRIFNFPFIEDEFVETCSLLKVYIHSITPVNHLISTVNVGIDILSHNKLSNVYNDDQDVLDGGRLIEDNVSVKNRNTVLLKSILHTLNGCLIQGVGTFQFNRELSESSNASLKLSNNRNFYGYSVVLSCQMSSMGAATNANRYR